MNEEDYPTDEQLEHIKTWDARAYRIGWLALMDYVGDIWHFRDWGWKQKGLTFWISTGGWSGNEDLIGAMQENFIFWSMCWHQARRGGHYIFKIKHLKKVKPATGGKNDNA